MSTYKVEAIEVLKGKPREAEAKDIITRVAKQVEPLLIKYHWRVGLLAEFFPSNRGLLGMNMNKGHKILLRLRPACAPSTFINIESILGTMLHELVHMEIGPHSTHFYERLEGLTHECEAMMAGGMNVFLSPHIPWEGEGQTLGGRGGGREGGTGGRGQLAAAAEKRRKGEGGGGGKGRRLGGGGGGGGGGERGGRKALSLREKILRAAEMRLKDQNRCRTMQQQHRRRRKGQRRKTAAALPLWESNVVENRQ
ncbi:hypothetical protein VYU27_010004, partial [Nannochloropsis oceanica]